MKPQPLLFFVETNPGEVRLELTRLASREHARLQVTPHQFSHETSRGEVALEKDHQVSPRKEDTTAKDNCCWYRTDRVVEGVETCGWKNESSHKWKIGKRVDGQGYCRSSSVPIEKSQGRISRLFVFAGVAMCGVHPQVWVVHCS